jgi:hypothetical protein
MTKKYTQKMVDIFKFDKNPVMISHHPKYKIEVIKHSDVKIHWEKLFKLLGLYQRFYEVLTPFKVDPNHFGKKLEYEIKVNKKKSDVNPHYYKIMIDHLGELVITEDDALYLPSENRSVYARPMYDSFGKFKKLLISILTDEYEMTAKDMKDCNYLFKLINKLEKK